MTVYQLPPTDPSIGTRHPEIGNPLLADSLDLAPFLDTLTHSPRIDNLLCTLHAQGIHATEDHLAEFLNSDRLKKHMDTRQKLLDLAAKTRAQDHALSAISTLHELTLVPRPNEKNTIAKRLAAHELLALAGLTPPKLPTEIIHHTSQSPTPHPNPNLHHNPNPIPTPPPSPSLTPTPAKHSLTFPRISLNSLLLLALFLLTLSDHFLSPHPNLPAPSFGVCSPPVVAINIDKVSKYFPSPRRGAAPTTAVDDVSVQIPSGSLFFLLGPSGCGKTTLLRMIAGFVLPTAGRILFDDKDMSTVPPYQRDTGMVFQSYALWPHMTVADNVGFGLDARKIRGVERETRIADALGLVQMDRLRDRRPNQLSGGQQQRVALARALAIRPQCLLLDEPLSNLDAKLRLEMRSEIRRIVKDSGITTIYVTHDQKEALAMAGAIAVMKNGRLEQVGTPADLYRRPRTRFVANFIGESNFLRATVESFAQGTVTLSTPAGIMYASIPSGVQLSPRTTVSIAFRPEAILLDSAAHASAGVNRLSGTCLSTTYLGEIAEYLIQVPGIEAPIKVFQMNPQDAAISSATSTAVQNVTLFIPPEHMMIVQD